jgi:CheY-like chemotaxis protein
MASKRALIVDDSKSARVILSRMLEKYDIEVDMAESAEQAIEYLNHHRPDAIFMDHLMPGMDGLQAVQAIKGNPQTAMIPIMMYTSQEGELYVGQARALGAMGVLPKQVRPVDVSKVLYELHLLPDRRDGEQPVLQPVELAEGDGAPQLVPAPVNGATPPAPVVDWGRRVEAAVKDQGVDLRRFVVASLDSFATRIVSDVRDVLPAPKPAGELVTPLPPAAAPKATVPWLIASGALACLAIICAALWASALKELDKVHGEVAALRSANVELTRSRQELADSVKDLSNALAAAPPAAPAPAAGATNWPPPRSEAVPFGELPLDRGRLDALRELLSKLEAQNFHGVVKVTSSAGLFCLSGNSADGFVPASGTLPVSKCDVIGNPMDESSSGQQRQSLAFANLIAGVRQRTSGAITVAVENTGNSRLATAYPPRSEALTAGEWNKAAAANNRVEFSVEPTAP